MNNLEEVIKTKYGSIDKMLEETDQISRAYIYRLVNGSKSNPTKNILQELARLLELTVDEVVELLDVEEV